MRKAEFKEFWWILILIPALYWWAYWNHQNAFKKVEKTVLLPKIEELKEKTKEGEGILKDTKLTGIVKENPDNFFDKVKSKFNKLVNWDMDNNSTDSTNSQIIEQPNGLAYKILKKGNGTERPTLNDKVLVNYVGRFENGEIFESTYSLKKPAELRMDSMIKGLQEVLLDMTEGEKREVKIPPELAYGEFDYYDIPANSTLIFEIELDEIKK